MVQRLKICLLVQGSQDQSLVQEDFTCQGATKPACHKYWAHVPQLLKSMRPRARTPQQEKLPQCPCTTREWPPLAATRKKPACSKEDPPHHHHHHQQFSHSVVSDSLQLHGLQHARPPCPSPTPGAYPNSCPLSRWCHPTISSSVTSFSSCPQSFPASGSFQLSQFFASGGQSIGLSASTSVLPVNNQDRWSPLGWIGWISLQSKGLSRVFSNTTVQPQPLINNF